MKDFLKLEDDVLEGYRNFYLMALNGNYEWGEGYCLCKNIDIEWLNDGYGIWWR